MNAKDFIELFINAYYPSNESYVIRIKKMCNDALQIVSGKTEEEKAVNSINYVGKIFKQIINFERKELTVEDLNLFIKSKGNK